MTVSAAVSHVVVRSLVPAVLLGLPPMIACAATERPRAESEAIVPLRELSGLAIRKTPNGEELLAVGDEARAIVATPIVGGRLDEARARTIALPMPEVEGGSELEGVAVDGDGKVWVLAERGEIFAYTLGDDGATEVWHRAITVPAGHLLEAAWNRDSNARAEGLAFYGGRVFIAKQADPAALVELVPEGDHFALGSTWTLADMDDASDLAVVGDALFVIGARSEVICRVADPGVVGRRLPCAKKWPLPDALGTGKTQWEGLTFLADGRPVVGVDRKKTDKANVALLPALTP